MSWGMTYIMVHRTCVNITRTCYRAVILTVATWLVFPLFRRDLVVATTSFAQNQYFLNSSHNFLFTEKLIIGPVKAVKNLFSIEIGFYYF
jgi:hypothetical protein